MRGGAAPNPGSPSTPEYPDQQEIERIVTREMPDYLRDICIEHYIRGGTVKDKARALHIGRAVYYRRLTEAKWWLRSRLRGRSVSHV